MKDLFGEDNSGAIFSNDRKYRYVLWRFWDNTKPKIMFVGLNPSTANEDFNDPTIRKIIAIAKNLNLGGIYMTNLFGFIASNPEKLENTQDPVGPENDKYLLEIIKKVDNIILAWGSFKIAKERARQLIKLFQAAKPLALSVNKDGSPKHPLYCKNKTIPKQFLN